MDGRKQNGGNSTKAKGVDKRKNPFKDVISNSISDSELKKVIKMLLLKSTIDKDVTAARILLEYCVGKPQQKMDITTKGDKMGIPTINFTDGED